MNERATFLCDTSGQTMTVYIRGEIDHHTAVSVRNGIDARLFDQHPRKLILDLSAVGFMDSSGLGLIMGRLSVMKSLGGEMLLRDPSKEIEVILRLAGMERFISIEYTEAPDPEIGETGKKAYACPKVSVQAKTTTQPKRHKHPSSSRSKRTKSPITSA